MAGPFACSARVVWMLVPIALHAQPDTLASAAPVRADSASAIRSTATSYLYGALCASYATGDSWGGHDVRNYAFTSDLLYRHVLAADGHGHLHQVLADVGYLKFVDSAWVKNLDRLQVDLLWSAQGPRWGRSWTTVLNTQFLPTSIIGYDPDGRVTQQRVGGFFSPFTLDAGYGAVWTFWEKCALNFAFATLHVAGSPKEATAPAFAEAHTAESDRAYYFLSYGFSLGALIDRSFGPHVQWLNTTRFFGNGLDRDHVALDLTNMVIVKPWKYLQVRIDTRLAYNPLLTYDLQFWQEVLVGFFYERGK